MFKIKVNGSPTPEIFNIPFLSDTEWKDAIELQEKPIVDSKQIVVSHYNYDTTPIEITYSTVDATISERKDICVKNVKHQFILLVNSHVYSPNTVYDIEVITVYYQDLISKIESITAATTHEELDAIVN